MRVKNSAWMLLTLRNRPGGRGSGDMPFERHGIHHLMNHFDRNGIFGQVWGIFVCLPSSISKRWLEHLNLSACGRR